MKNEFEKTIQAFLDGKAAGDPLFAERYAREGKSIGQCCRYIIGEVRKSGRQGFADAEIYGMAIHYYDEDDVKVEDAGKCTVVVNHEIRLTEEEKREIEEKARKELEDEELGRAKERIRMEKAKQEKERKDAEERARKEAERKRREAEESGMLFLFNDGEER